MHKHNLDLLDKEESKSSSVHHKASPEAEGGQSGQSVVREFGFHVDHYLGPFFHVPGNSWQKDWLVSDSLIIAF